MFRRTDRHRVMLKRLATLFMQTLMVAALILSGSGVQASQVTPMENMQLQEQSMAAGCTMDMAADEMAAMSDAEGTTAGCQMEVDSCHSTCASCQAVNGDMPPVHSGVTYPLSSAAGLAVIAAQYPIDHPPKLAPSL